MEGFRAVYGEANGTRVLPVRREDVTHALEISEASE
jgi:hypothetical protein